MTEQNPHTQPSDHGNEVFVFIERITPIDGRADDVLNISRKSAALLKNQPGLIQAMVTRSEKATGTVCSISVWGRKADFQAFMKTEAVAELLKSEDFQNIKAWMSDYDMEMTNLVDGWHG